MSQIQDSLQNMSEPNAWDRLPDESQRHHSWFEAYRLLGRNRSLVAAYRQVHPEKVGKGQDVPNSWRQTALQFDWTQRASEWDRYQDAKAEAAYEQRVKEFQENAFDLGVQLLERSRKMLDFPLSEQKTTKVTETPDGRTIIHEVTIKPIRFSADSIHRTAKAAAELVLASEGIHVKQLDDRLNQLSEEELLAELRHSVAELEAKLRQSGRPER